MNIFSHNIKSQQVSFDRDNDLTGKLQDGWGALQDSAEVLQDTA